MRSSDRSILSFSPRSKLMDVKNYLLKTENLFIENEYFDKYIELIKHNLSTTYIKYKTQIHHCVPRSYYRIKYSIKDYKEASLRANNDSNNILINLLFKDHILAHYYLSLCTKDPYRMPNLMAFESMISKIKGGLEGLDKRQSLYEEYQSFNSNRIKINKPWLYNKGIPRCGFSEETKLLMSESQKGMYKDHIWINNGEKQIHIPKEELSKYPNWGLGILDSTKTKISLALKGKAPYRPNFKQSEYQKQRSREANSHPKTEITKARISKARSNCVFVYKEGSKHSILIPKEELNNYLNSGYKKGRLSTKQYKTT